MFKHLTHLIGAAAIALAASSAPAVAQDRNNEAVGNAIIGLTFLALVGAAFANSDNDRPSVQSNVQPDQQRQNAWGHGRDGVRTRDNGRQDRGWHADRLAPLPDECLSARLINREARLVYGQTCLNRNYSDVAQLRNQCRVTFDTQRGLRQGYDADCLAADPRIRRN